MSIWHTRAVLLRCHHVYHLSPLCKQLRKGYRAGGKGPTATARPLSSRDIDPRHVLLWKFLRETGTFLFWSHKPGGGEWEEFMPQQPTKLSFLVYSVRKLSLMVIQLIIRSNFSPIHPISESGNPSTSLQSSPHSSQNKQTNKPHVLFGSRWETANRSLNHPIITIHSVA